MLKINLTSVMVNDQAKAEAFYVGKLGFVKKQDFPIGEARWLTVASEAGGEVELLLEPMGMEAAKVFQKALFDAGVPLTSFASDDVFAEYKRLMALGVVFRGEPQKTGDFPTIARFEDGCGNLIQMHETPMDA